MCRQVVHIEAHSEVAYAPAYSGLCRQVVHIEVHIEVACGPASWTVVSIYSPHTEVVCNTSFTVMRFACACISCSKSQTLFAVEF